MIEQPTDHRCRACHGRGGHIQHDQDGPYIVPCADCLARGICPRCASEFDIVDLHPLEAFFCVACGWIVNVGRLQERGMVLNELVLDLLRTAVMAARQNDTDVVLGWRVMLAMLDEIHALRQQRDERMRAVRDPNHPTPPEITALREEAPHEQADEPVGE